MKLKMAVTVPEDSALLKCFLVTMIADISGYSLEYLTFCETNSIQHIKMKMEDTICECSY